MSTGTAAKKKTPNINWRNSAAKQTLMDDLETGVLSLYAEECSVEAAWQKYKTLPEFKPVPFEQFKRQLKAHRKQVLCRKERLGHEEAAMAQFREKNPRKTHNNRFEPVFDMMPGKKLLRQDVKDGLHEQLGLKNFRKSRDEYKVLTPQKFKERVYQEIRRQKYLNYLALETEKRQKKYKRCKKTKDSGEEENDGSVSL